MTIKFFVTPSKWRARLEKNHASKKELLVGFYKLGSGKPSITWPESVDQALCFGWIDGIRRRIDDDSYSIRFTPRKKSSNWSTINIKRVSELEELGLMKPAGRVAFDLREDRRSSIYTYERKALVLNPTFEKMFKSNLKALQFFQTQPPSYQKTAIDWVMRAVKEETRLRRFTVFVEDCQAGRKIKPLRY